VYALWADFIIRITPGSTFFPALRGFSVAPLYFFSLKRAAVPATLHMVDILPMYAVNEPEKHGFQVRGRLVVRAEFAFVRSTDRANPVFGQIFEFGASRDVTVRIAHFRVIHIATDIADVFHCSLLVFLLPGQYARKF
jgi:hypothetical protein